jgi:mRNA interferase MazF
MNPAYVPDRGDLVWLSFDPQAGHEQSGRHPALTVSPQAYNQRTGLGIFCPVTSQVKGYPFEVHVPQGLPITGVILADQVRSLDWQARGAQLIGVLAGQAVAETLGKIKVLFG